MLLLNLLTAYLQENSRFSKGESRRVLSSIEKFYESNCLLPLPYTRKEKHLPRSTPFISLKSEDLPSSFHTYSSMSQEDSDQFGAIFISNLELATSLTSRIPEGTLLGLIRTSYIFTSNSTAMRLEVK